VTKVAIYSMNYSDRLLSVLPYTKFYGERSLSLLSALRDEGVRLILITSAEVDPYIIDWHLRELFGLDDELLRSARGRLALFSFKPGAVGPLDELVLNDRRILDYLGAGARRGSLRLVNFAASAATDRIGCLTGIPVEEGPVDLSEQWGSKSGGKMIFGLSNLPTPRGTTEVFWTVDGLLRGVLNLARCSPAPKLLVAKLNHSGWADGFGNVTIDCQEAIDQNDLRPALRATLQSWDSFVTEMSEGGAIVEEYLAERISSPSGQGRIEPSGQVRVLATHQQVLRGDEYLGCEFPGRSHLRTRIREAMASIGSTLATKGVRGSFGADFIELPDGSLLAVEINLRKVGPSHVVDYVEAVLGKRVDDHGDLRLNGRRVHYFHRRVWEPALLRGVRASDALEALGDAGLLFRRERGTGAILHILGALPSEGYVETTCLEFSREATHELDRRVQAVLTCAGRLKKTLKRHS
jgi:hypothetical protein